MIDLVIRIKYLIKSILLDVYFKKRPFRVEKILYRLYKKGIRVIKKNI
ncbi:hypothetical protein BN130_3420 [Cronobacter malonaticus 507]|nr:hypothetical protein BN130_3420 [Cronobacter malonaticus 507]